MTLTEVAPGTGKDGKGTPAIDFIAIHGLNPRGKTNHAWQTWTTASKRLWLRDDLPRDLPDVRILLYEYDSIPVLMSSKTRLAHQASDLLFCMDIERVKCPTRPIVFVAHSLGGILVKQALLNALSNPEFADIKKSTCGLAFFGTPHAGGNETLASFGKKCAAIVNAVTRSSANDLIDAVTPGSQYADTLAENWKHQLSNYRILSFYEGIGNVVPRESAVIGLPGDMEIVVLIEADHSNMCRFDTSDKKDMANYKKVRHGLGKIREAALGPPSTASAVQVPNAQTSHEAHGDTMTSPMPNPMALQRRGTSDSEAEVSVPMQFNANILHVLQLVERHTAPSVGENPTPRPGRELFDSSFVLPTFLRSFNHFDYRDAFDEISGKKYRSTCDWIFGTSEVAWWTRGRTSRLLWLTGDHGIGKSTLATHMVEELKSPGKDRGELLDIPHKSVVLYGICHNQNNHSASMIISTLLHQLIRRNPALQTFAYETDTVDCLGKADFRITKAKNRSASILLHLLYRVIENSGLEVVFIVIDGLDQCQDGSEKQLVSLLMLGFEKHKSAKTAVKLFITSRPGNAMFDMQSRWEDKCPETILRMSAGDFEDQIQRDVDSFGHGEVKRMRRLKGYSDSEMEPVENHLANDESKNFLAVTMLLDRLDKVLPSRFSEVLHGISSDLNELYRSLVLGLPLHLRSEPSQLVTHVTYSRRPLTLAELAYMIDGLGVTATPKAVMGDEDVVRMKSRIDVFSPVLKVHKDKTVSFYHATIREYVLEQSSSGRVDFLVSSSKTGHRNLAVLCLREIVLASDIDFAPPHASSRSNEKLLSSRTFISYALYYWHIHLKEAVPSDTPIDQIDGEIILSVRDLVELWKDPKTKNYRRFMLSCCGLKSFGDLGSDLVPLEVLSAIGVDPILRLYLGSLRGVAFTMLQPYVAQAVNLAIKEGNEEVLATLVKTFEITSLEGKQYADVLINSAGSGRPNMVDKVLRLRRTRTRELVPSLVAAFTRGEQATLDSLAADGSLFEDRDHFGMTALHALFACSHEMKDKTYVKAMGIVRAIASYLLDNGVHIAARDNFGFTALHWACSSAHFCNRDIIEFLVSRGANPHDQNVTGLTPLHVAAYHTRNVDAVDCLLEHGGSSLIGKASYGLMTPLHWAMSRRSEIPGTPGWEWRESDHTVEVIKKLLHHGANPHAINRRGMTALEYGRTCQEDWQWAFTGGLEGVDYIQITIFAGPQELMWQDWHRVDEEAPNIAGQSPRRYQALQSAETSGGSPTRWGLGGFVEDEEDGSGGDAETEEDGSLEVQVEIPVLPVDPRAGARLGPSSSGSAGRRHTPIFRAVISKRAWRELGQKLRRREPRP